MKKWLWCLAVLVVGVLAGCSEDTGGGDTVAGDEVPFAGGDPCPEGGCEEIEIGDFVADQKTDGDWTEALKCKPIPEMEPLVDPKIIISLDGLTLRLVDQAGDYDRVFPIGPGAINSAGVSKTPLSTGAPDGVFYTRTDKPQVVDNPQVERALWAWNFSCRFWGHGLPYFGGLPFIRLEGTSRAVYGIHGPIDQFTLPSGGLLRRGYVSAGCLRMDPDDLVEVYALIQGHKAPVRIQKALDRREDGTAVDIDDNWLLSECQSDEDCRFDGGVCRTNAYSGRGYCTSVCDGFCADRERYPNTMCVADPNGGEEGICVPFSDPTTNGCARYGAFDALSAASLGDPNKVRDVCLPVPEGWIGAYCLSDTDCTTEGTVCSPLASGEEGAPGICSMPCEQFCPDTDGAPSTFCVNAQVVTGAEEGGACVAQCQQDGDCPLGLRCVEESRINQPERTATVCLP